MKNTIVIILTLIAVNAFAGKIPEAKELHSELYTIQFTFASFPSDDDLELDDKEYKIACEEYENLLEDIDWEEEFEDEDSGMARALLYGRVMRKADINHIESCKEVEYKDLATIYTSSGEPFPEAYSNVKGMLDVESNKMVLNIYFPGFVDSFRECDVPDFFVNEWRGVVGMTGGYRHGYVLVKCYPPTNVPSNQTSENKD